MILSTKLHRLVFSLRYSKEARLDLDWEEEERGRNARREAEEKNNTNAVCEEDKSKTSNKHAITLNKTPQGMQSIFNKSPSVFKQHVIFKNVYFHLNHLN